MLQVRIAVEDPLILPVCAQRQSKYKPLFEDKQRGTLPCPSPQLQTCTFLQDLHRALCACVQKKAILVKQPESYGDSILPGINHLTCHLLLNCLSIEAKHSLVHTHTHTHAHANTDTHQIPSLPPTPWTTPAFYPTSLSQIDPGHHKPAACTPRTQPNPCTLPQPTKAAAADPSKTTQTSKPLTLGALPGFRQATHAGPGASQAQRAQNTVRQRARSHVYMQCAIAQTGHNTQCARGHVHTRTHSALAELGHNTLCARGQAGAAPGYMGMMHVQCASTKQSGNVPTPGYGRPGVW